MRFTPMLVLFVANLLTVNADENRQSTVQQTDHIYENVTRSLWLWDHRMKSLVVRRSDVDVVLMHKYGNFELSDLTILDTTFRDAFFSGCHNLVNLAIINSDLTELEVRFEKLVNFRLINSKITRPVSFNRLKNVKRLTIESMNFTLNGLSQLDQLNIHSLELKNLERTDDVSLSEVNLPLLDTFRVESVSLQGLNMSCWIFPNLRVLELIDNQLLDVPDNIAEFRQLKLLIIQGNNFSQHQLEPYADFNNLTSLNLTDNEIRQFLLTEPISLPELGELIIANNMLEELTCLENLQMPKLNLIDLQNNRIASFEILVPMKTRIPHLLLVVSKQEVCESTLSDEEKEMVFGVQCEVSM
ncbi:leucine-rich repeat-containing protein 15-like [Uranotaenia lowii]|uniref:leucine-rich repeat-containing protein 15-like n=1 Tax=Uranotaenia lowii TaxID=190385 RepID=UPI002478577E|nr:leucine-rich repeat-containing protein 15-like [Uranotaenia lowii]